METRPERIIFLKVPIDIVKPEELPHLIAGFLSAGRKPNAQLGPGDIPQTQNGTDIVLLSLWDLLKARRNSEYREYLFTAAMVIPISKSLVSGVKFLTGKNVIRYMPFKFVISLLTTLEKREESLYLLGGANSVLKKTEKNIRSTFPKLKIVGRYEGSIRKQEEAAVIEAIRKAAPSLLLAGRGIRGKELWIARNSPRLNSGLRLWCSDLFDVFAEKKRRPSDAVFEHGLESLGYCFRNPVKFLRIFSWFRYKILLLFYRFSKSNAA